MLGNQPHLCGPHVLSSPWDVLSYKKKAKQLRGNSWGCWKLRKPSLAWFRSAALVSSWMVTHSIKKEKKERNPQDRAINKRLRILLPSGSSQVPRWATKILEQERTSRYKPTEEEHPFQSRSGKTSWEKWLLKEKWGPQESGQFKRCRREVPTGNMAYAKAGRVSSSLCL